MVLIPNKTGNSLWLLDEFLGEKRKPRPLEYSDTRQPGFSKIFVMAKGDKGVAVENLETNQMTEQLISEMVKILGKDQVKQELEDLICYSYDSTNMIEMPGVVVFPKRQQRFLAY